MSLLSVPDMSCGHCKASVEAALAPLPGVQAVVVDVVTRQVQITGPATVPTLIAALASIGFPALTVSHPVDN